MSLYSQYLSELQNREIIETDYGFITYYYVPDGCYIADIYILPEHRRGRKAFDLADQVAVIAKKSDVHTLIGSVILNVQGATTSLKMLLAYGFELKSTGSNFIIMSKGI